MLLFLENGLLKIHFLSKVKLNRYIYLTLCNVEFKNTLPPLWWY